MPADLVWCATHGHPYGPHDCSARATKTDAICDKDCGETWPDCGHTLTKTMTSERSA